MNDQSMEIDQCNYGVTNSETINPFKNNNEKMINNEKMNENKDNQKTSIFDFDSLMDKGVNFKIVNSWKNEFLIEKKLGEGSFATCFQVKINGQGKSKAMKLIQKKSDYLLEIEHLCRLKGIPGILPLEEVYMDDKKVGLITPLGLKFEKWWDIRKKEHNGNALIFLEDILCIAKNLMSSIQQMHDRRIVHRDLTLSNLVFSNNRPQIIDFGFSKNACEAEIFSCDYHLTTRDFRAPELVDPDFYMEEQSLNLNIKNENQFNKSKKSNSKKSNSNKSNSNNSNKSNDSDTNKTSKKDKFQKKIKQENQENNKDEINESNRSKYETIDGMDVEVIRVKVKGSPSSVIWRNIFDNEDLKRMQWGNETKKTKRIHYYNEKMDEWSLGCILYYLLMNELPFADSIHQKWYEYHKHYYNYYDKWINPNQLKIFEKIEADKSLKHSLKITPFNLMEKVNGKLLSLFDNSKHKSNDQIETSKLLSLYSDWISVIIYDLLTPNPKKRSNSRDLLLRIYSHNSLSQSIINKPKNELPQRNLNDNDLDELNYENDLKNGLKLDLNQAIYIANILNLFFSHARKEQIYAPIFYQTIYLWGNNCFNLKNMDLLTSFVLCYEFMLIYFNTDLGFVYAFRKKSSKVVSDLINERLFLLNHLKGFFLNTKLMSNFWNQKQKHWNNLREKNAGNFILRCVRVYGFFPYELSLDKFLKNKLKIKV